MSIDECTDAYDEYPDNDPDLQEESDYEAVTLESRRHSRTVINNA
jgi:hypothetical protein